MEANEQVLNAFRHQRTNYDPGGDGPPPARIVLNAFRHQRTNYEAITKILAELIVCSTPFGINERTTARQRLHNIGLNVLNAFRHQRTNYCLPSGTLRSRAPVLNAFRHQRTNYSLVVGLAMAL